MGGDELWPTALLGLVQSQGMCMWVWQLGGAEIYMMFHCCCPQVLDEVEAGYRLEIPKVCRHVFEVKLICLTNAIV